MKIKINEFEKYEILFPQDEIDASSFLGLMSRLENVRRVIEKSMIVTSSVSDNPSKIIKKYRTREPAKKLLFMENRNELLKVLRLQYFYSIEERKQYAQSQGVEWVAINQRLPKYKEIFSIKPEEIGLIRFPIGSDGRLTPKLIEGLKIK